MFATGFFIFVVCSILGWIWEVFLNIVCCGQYVNRGILYGPWLPIYGVGALIVLFIVINVREPLKIFIISAAACGMLEYMTSYIMEALWKMRWWNYSGAFSVNGRINLLVLLVFGCIGLIFNYVLVPNLDRIYNYAVDPSKMVVMVVLCIILADFVYAQIHPNIASMSSHHPF